MANGTMSNPSASSTAASNWECDFLDTADMYGIGANEELVGRAIRDRAR